MSTLNVYKINKEFPFSGTMEARDLIIFQLDKGSVGHCDRGWYFQGSNGESLFTRKDFEYQLMRCLMDYYSDLGASDSEGFHVLDEVTNRINDGEEISAWDRYHNPNYWQLYGGFGDGNEHKREIAANLLGKQLRRYYRAAIVEKFSLFNVE